MTEIEPFISIDQDPNITFRSSCSTHYIYCLLAIKGVRMKLGTLIEEESNLDNVSGDIV